MRNLAYATYHDLREPVRGININAQLLQSKHGSELSPQVQESIEYMAEESKRLYAAVDSILQMTFLESERYPKELVSLAKLLPEVESDLKPVVDKTHAEIKYGELPKVNGNESLLRILFENILQNSLNFKSALKPVIEISFSEDYYCYIITITDNGVGFDNKYSNQIFEMFKRLGNSNYRGAGLGLAICQRIVQIHNGRISATSEIGKGTTITISLPKPFVRPKKVYSFLL